MASSKRSKIQLIIVLACAAAFWGAVAWATFQPKPVEQPCYHDCYKTYDQMKADTANTGTAGRASTQQ